MPIARSYGTVARSCVPADPPSKGGTESVGRFAEGGLLSILDHRSGHDHTEPIRRSEAHGLPPGTFAWSGFGSA